MFRTKTVFVIGAGASCEFNFPSGQKLLKEIAEALSIRFDISRQTHGDEQLMATMRHHLKRTGSDGKVQAYVDAGRRLAAAASIAKSIDNAIDQNDGDPLVPIVGKMAIAQRILKAEAASPLRPMSSEQQMPDIKAIAGTWLYEFGQMLTTDVRASQAENIFDNVAVISFNYDRAIEFSLPAILSAAYGFPLEKCVEIAKSLRIWHPYGSLGSLAYDRRPGVGFGAAADLCDVADKILTFGESVRDVEAKSSWREAIRRSYQIVFLGFGFHRPNLELLAPSEGGSMVRVLGTAYQEPSPAVETTISQLKAMFSMGSARPALPSLYKAAEFLKRYHVPITA